MHGVAIPSSDGDRRAVSVSTPRLCLAPVSAADLEELFALHADPRAFADDLTEPLTDREQMRWVLGQWIESWRRHGTGHLTVRARSAAADEPELRTAPSSLSPGLLGVVGLIPLEVDGTQALSAYWRLAPEATGHGLATEAMRAVLAHPRLGGRDGEVVAVTAAGNAASRALADRLGFWPAPPRRAVPGGRDGDVLLVRP